MSHLKIYLLCLSNHGNMFYIKKVTVMPQRVSQTLKDSKLYSQDLVPRK